MLRIVKSGTTYKLYYSGAKQSDVTISIRDAGDRIVYKEVLKNVSGFVRPYNFSHLEEGSYTMEIKDSNGLLTEKIRYGKTGEANFARVVRLLDGEHKYLLMLSSKTPTNMRVKIFDESDNVIYSQEENITGDFAKVYNLQKYDGPGRFEITDGNGISRSMSYK